MTQTTRKASRREQLEKQGWKMQTTYDEPRLGELVAAYKEAGLEVRVEDAEPADNAECQACFGGSAGRLKTIYTREKARKS